MITAVNHHEELKCEGTVSRDRFKKTKKVDKSRPKEGKRKVLNFQGLLLFNSKEKKILAVNAKSTLIAYVSMLFLQP
jgi:hypothetical protein